jgi:hypothetical protein
MPFEFFAGSHDFHDAAKVVKRKGTKFNGNLVPTYFSLFDVCNDSLMIISALMAVLEGLFIT